MSVDLFDETDAIQSIYGPEVLREADCASFYILSIPHRETSLRVLFPPDYPDSMPQLLSVETIGPHTRKGYGSHVLDTARAILLSIFSPGSVCLFDLLQELETALAEESLSSCANDVESFATNTAHSDLPAEPCWTSSSTVSEKRSTFQAMACAVTSPAQAQASIAHLNLDKRAAKATHRISAYRIRAPSAVEKLGEIIYQDFDDDGEKAAGGRLLHLLQLMDVWNVLVVVKRWYGGVKLGPNRFNIINIVAQEAVVKGGWAKSRNKDN